LHAAPLQAEPIIRQCSNCVNGTSRERTMTMMDAGRAGGAARHHHYFGCEGKQSRNRRAPIRCKRQSSDKCSMTYSGHVVVGVAPGEGFGRPESVSGEDDGSRPGPAAACSSSPSPSSSSSSASLSPLPFPLSQEGRERPRRRDGGDNGATERRAEDGVRGQGRGRGLPGGRLYGRARLSGHPN